MAQAQAPAQAHAQAQAMVLLTDVLHADGMEGARLGWAAHPDRGFADAAVSSPDSRPTIAPPATAAALAISEPPRAPIHVPGSPAQITPAAAMAAPAMIARPRPSAATREVITAATRAFNAQIKDGSGAQALRQMAQQTALREQSKMFGAIIDDLDPAGRLGFRSFDYTFTPRPNRAPEMTFRAIKPLYDDEDGTGTGFLQMGFASTEETGTTWNAGLVHRQMLPGGAWLGGGNVFFDYAPQHGHQRLSLGLEAMTDRFSISANRYMALTDWQPGRPGYEERALSGYDLQVAGDVPMLPAVRVTGNAYRWWRQTGADLYGNEVGIEYRPSGIMALRVASRANSNSPRKTVASLNLSYQLGTPLAGQTARPKVRGTTPLERRFDAVRRENTIQTEERLIDVVPPAGYAIAFVDATVTDDNARSLALTLTGAEVGTIYAFEIVNMAAPNATVRGTGKVTAQTMQISGIDVAALANGTLTAHLTLTDARGNRGLEAKASIPKATTQPISTTNLGSAPAVNLANQDAFSFELETGTAWHSFSFVIRTAAGDSTGVAGTGRIENGVMRVADIDLAALPDGPLSINIALAAPTSASNAFLTFALVKDVAVPRVTAIEPPRAGANAGV